jgi:pilus assembly protein CpaE
MRSDHVHFEHAANAIFSICATPDVVSAALSACSEISGSAFVGEFHDYFTPDRRPQLSSSLKAANICVAVVDCDRDPEMAISTMERLRTMMLTNLSIVAFSTHMEASYLLRAMRAGCNEFLSKPADACALRDALLRFEATHTISIGRKESQGRIICFYGAKGGVGTTTLAVHVANNLVRRHRKRTLLIDHQHELGHVALYLGMKEGNYHFDELVLNADRLDLALLQGFVTRHSSGLDVLTSHDNCAPDHKSSPEEIELVLNFLRTQYEYVIIDSNMSYKSIVKPMLRGCDEVCIVSTPDVAALRDLARRIDHLSLDDEAARKLRIVINRSTSADAVTSDQIEAAVKQPVWISIPNAYADLVSAINAGEPIRADHRSPFAQQINKWALKLIDSGAPRAEQPSAQKKKFSFWRTGTEQVA